MLAVVTQRMQVPHILREAVRRICATGGLPQLVRPFSTLHDAVESAAGAAFLILDMAAVPPTEDVEEYVIWWKTKNGSGQVIVINAPQGSEALGKQLFSIAAHSSMRLLDHKEALLPDVWAELLLAHPFALEMNALRIALESELLSRFVRVGDVPNYDLTFQLFNLSPKSWRVSDFLHTDDTVTEKAQRNKFGSYFRKAGQACPRDLITAFRVLIFVRLTELNRANRKQWTPREIANQLQQGNATAMRNFFKERTGLTIPELGQLRTGEVRAVIVTMLLPAVQVPFRERIQAVHATIAAQVDRNPPSVPLFKTF